MATNGNYMVHLFNANVVYLTMQINIITDKLRSYSAAKKELIPDVEHSTQQYENNRCELSHYTCQAAHFSLSLKFYEKNFNNTRCMC
jgi:transposase-like protein